MPGFVTKWPSLSRSVWAAASASSGNDSCQRMCESYVQPYSKPWRSASWRSSSIRWWGGSGRTVTPKESIGKTSISPWLLGFDGFSAAGPGTRRRIRTDEKEAHALAKMLFRLPEAARVISNPSAEELQQLAARMPSARWTKYGNLNVQTNVLARSTPSTFIVTDEDEAGLSQTITRDEAEEWAAKQDAYIATQEMVLVDGWLGAQGEFRVPVRLYIGP